MIKSLNKNVLLSFYIILTILLCFPPSLEKGYKGANKTRVIILKKNKTVKIDKTLTLRYDKIFRGRVMIVDENNSKHLFRNDGLKSVYRGMIIQINQTDEDKIIIELSKPNTNYSSNMTRR